jgi:hypothetical protein
MMDKTPKMAERIENIEKIYEDRVYREFALFPP